MTTKAFEDPDWISGASPAQYTVSAVASVSPLSLNHQTAMMEGSISFSVEVQQREVAGWVINPREEGCLRAEYVGESPLPCGKLSSPRLHGATR